MQPEVVNPSSNPVASNSSCDQFTAAENSEGHTVAGEDPATAAAITQLAADTSAPPGAHEYAGYWLGRDAASSQGRQSDVVGIRLSCSG